MAERRMFTIKIVESDPFTEMPLSAQALYFHLNMAADDDGFINNPQKIRRSIDASEDDFELLVTKRFLLTFENGLVVIKHWRMHNLLRKDRYKPTQYQDELSSLRVRDDGAYTENHPNMPDEDENEGFGNHSATIRQPSDNQVATIRQPFGNHSATNGIPTDNQWLPQGSIGKDSIDKDSLGECEGRIGQGKTMQPHAPTLDDVIQYCQSKKYTFAEKFFSYYQSVNWLDKNGKPFDWRSKADYWHLCDEEKKPQKPRYGDFDPEEAFQRALQRSFPEEAKEPPKTVADDEDLRKKADALREKIGMGG